MVSENRLLFPAGRACAAFRHKDIHLFLLRGWVKNSSQLIVSGDPVKARGVA